MCPNCGHPLPAGAPAGLCPACLLEQGAETVTSDQAHPVRFEPPPVEEVARLFPQLEIIGLIGAGGMGAVYRARQPALDRQVALKILPPHGGGGASFAERFNREARALARLNHPNIVAVHEFGQVQGLHFFIMEFVDGANLRQLEKTGRLSPREALQIVPQICDALQYAHDEGVVHRDIKPENVLVDRKGRVKIADFGLAKILGIEGESLRLTADGQVMGTPHYMAPEQVERPMSVDHRADIYSLGVVFYEMLTGDLPLGKFAPPSRKVEVDVRLDEVVLRALENDPARRYQHASEVKSEVETIRHAPAPPVPPVGAVASPEPPPRFSRTAIVGAGWAPLFFIMSLLWVTPLMQAESDSRVPGLTWWQWVLTLTLLPLGLAAPFGTTILGWISVTQIGRSAGRLYGLGLALFDGLVFPLLLLDLVLGLLLLRSATALAQAAGVSLQNGLWPVLVGLVTLSLCAAADVFLARTIWRMVSGTGSAETRGAYAPGRQLAYGVGGLAAVIAIVAAISALSNGPLYQLFHRGSAQLAGRDAASGAFVAHVPGGGTIELLGLSDPDAAPDGWWGPDGSSLAHRRVEVAGLGEAKGPNAELKNLILRYQDLPEGASFPAVEFVPPASFSSGGWVTLDGKPLAGSLPFRVAFPAGLQTAAMRVGVDWGPWSTTLTHDPRTERSTQARRPGDPGWEAVIHQVSDNAGNAQVTVMLGRDDPSWKTRVIAVDTNGVERPYSNGSGTPAGTMQAWTFVFRGLPLAAVKEFQVQVRPVHWYDFPRIALRPRQPVPPARQQTSLEQRPVSRPTLTVAQLAASPDLRFLAWQDAWEAREPDAAIHRDGSPVATEHERRVLRQVRPTKCSVAGASEGTPQTRFLHLWFAHPGFDAQSDGEVALFDGTGALVASSAAGPAAYNAHPADAECPEAGWLACTLMVSNDLPQQVTVRLRFTVGPLENVREVAADFRGSLALEGDGQLSGLGADEQGKAFIALACDSPTLSSRHFAATAITREGGKLEPTGRMVTGGGSSSLTVGRYEFEVPLTEVARFQVGTRPVRSAEWAGVRLPELPL